MPASPSPHTPARRDAAAPTLRLRNDLPWLTWRPATRGGERRALPTWQEDGAGEATLACVGPCLPIDPDPYVHPKEIHHELQPFRPGHPGAGRRHDPRRTAGRCQERGPQPARSQAIPVSEPAPVNLNPLAAFWAQWAAYWGD